VFSLAGKVRQEHLPRVVGDHEFDAGPDRDRLRCHAAALEDQHLLPKNDEVYLLVGWTVPCDRATPFATARGCPQLSGGGHGWHGIPPFNGRFGMGDASFRRLQTVRLNAGLECFLVYGHIFTGVSDALHKRPAITRQQGDCSARSTKNRGVAEISCDVF
jgi:hypothetical protein